MVVEDRTTVRLGLVQAIESHGAMRVVAQAADGLEAIRLHRQYRPDVTVMDVRLPHLDGIEAIRRIRTERPGAQFVVLTFYGEDESVRAGLREVGCPWVPKTPDLDELLRTIDAAGQ